MSRRIGSNLSLAPVPTAPSIHAAGPLRLAEAA